MSPYTPEDFQRSPRRQPYKSPFILYELSDEVKRKEFLDELFSFMQKRGTPINRLPIMAKQVLDLYELYNLVVASAASWTSSTRLWQEIIRD
ncbi:protein dead ringer homolog [Homarus americanus]|uniref:protein dead ringer homolog n=1 Tax=Homarus americanus TaxID=6706 RepID=UPI001C48A88E|nr:protein dead ringer homolog [Homarus americanus]